DGSSWLGPGPGARGTPTSWKQKLPTLLPPVGAVPLGQAPPVDPAATAWETKIWNVELVATFDSDGSPAALAVMPLSASCQTTHGAGLPPAVVVPPNSIGSIASRLVLMLSDSLFGADGRS